jgi:hypothetical protein
MKAYPRNIFAAIRSLSFSKVSTNSDLNCSTVNRPPKLALNPTSQHFRRVFQRVELQGKP